MGLSDRAIAGGDLGAFSPSLEQIRQCHTAEVAFGQETSGASGNGFSENVSQIWLSEGVINPAIASKLCTDPWALRHRLVNTSTGESIPMTCDRYSCLYCGPRRVSRWRDLVVLAEPQRFATLSRMSDTLAGASRVLTTVLQRLRRNDVAIEYFATFERHKNGMFHAHLLLNGDYIPQPFLSECLRSATHGASFVVDIRRAEGQVAGYVAKYVTKHLTAAEVGSKSDGTRAHPRRIRYSRGFFPSPTAVLRQQLRDDWLASRSVTEDVPLELLSPDGHWALVESSPLPRLARPGHPIDQRAAGRQYCELVERRAAEVGTEARMSRGGLMVLSYMLSGGAE